MTDVSFADQRGIFDPDNWGWPVHVVGLGGIGSALVLPLVKLGVREVHIWDNDEVEPHNVPAQLLYRKSDIGKTKVSAIADIVESYGMDVELHQHEQWVTPTTALKGVVLSGVDSMASRKAIWEAIKFNPWVPLYIDGRIGAEHAQVLTVNPTKDSSIERYEPWLFDDDGAAELPCSARTIIHSPLQLATWMITQLTLHARGKVLDGFISVNLQELQYASSIRLT